MRKILAIVTVVILCLSFSSCIEEEVPQKEIGTTQKTDSVQQETFALNETAVFNNLKITATQVKESEGTAFFEPESGNVFVGIKLTIENSSDQEKTISSLMMFDSYVDDVKCDYSINAMCVFDEGTLDGNIASGKKLVGWYALEVPADWSSIELNVKPSLFSNGSATFVFTK